ncbi:hypothetical protein B0H16DRAFT_1723244 [Mycena metata]|uniref:Uncharacterized protein n=1 Tax=Mycena metata TaxID=1033252 RepID=A0AAD7J2N9_9AGAR|nr:hypothetical protein B0H16DRAFT_1723244 [Mycena metata]
MTGELWELATRCWTANTSDRPTATQVHDELASMIFNPQIALHNVPSAALGEPVVHTLPPNIPTLGVPGIQHPPPPDPQHESPFHQVSEVSQMAQQLQIAAFDGLIPWKDLNLDPDGVAALRRRQVKRQLKCKPRSLDHLCVDFLIGLTDFRSGTGIQPRLERIQQYGAAFGTYMFSFYLAAVYRAVKRLNEALETGLMVVKQETVWLDSWLANGGRNSPQDLQRLRRYTYVQGLALTHHDMNNNQQAMAPQLEVFTGRHKILGIKHRDTVMAMRTLAVFCAVWAYESGGNPTNETLEETFNRERQILKEFLGSWIFCILDSTL